jgi:hypothetical protein
MTEAGRMDDAREVSENLLAALEGDASGQYSNEMSLIRFYLSLIK